MTTERIEVERTIAADPATIFRVLCDPQGHVEVDSSGMLMAATGEPVTAVGDTFVVHMDREALNDYPMGLYDVTVQITTFVPDRENAWTTVGVIDLPLGHIYGYTLAPVDDGTLVTSYYDWSPVRAEFREAGVFPIIPEAALRATLGILARTVTRPGAMTGIDVVDSYFAAIRARDAEALVALFTDDAALVTIAGTFTGPDAIAGFYRDLAFRTEDLWPEPGPPIVDGARIAVEIRLRANGKISLVGDFFTLREGRISRLLICNGPPE